MIEDVIKELIDAVTKATEAFKRDLSRVRTGRANLAILDSVKVAYYGSNVPLNQVASVSIPDARLILIKPWEKSTIPDIEKAINVAEIGLTPQNDGEVVRLPIPALTEERRKELVKQTKKLTESAKVSVRNHRRDSNDFLKELEKSKEISEDDKKRGLDLTQKETDKAVAKIDEIFAEKEKEIMEI
ncbi:MAG: ribosome recycling factor [Deltaproteobacteria bacterium]|nr:ribosome recycling factor [Deltaproteobacteria bacterium]